MSMPRPTDRRAQVGVQARVQALVLEVVADVRHRRCRRAEHLDLEPVVLPVAAGLARARLDGHDVVARERAGRAPARTCSNRCRRSWGGTSQWQSGSACHRAWSSRPASAPAIAAASALAMPGPAEVAHDTIPGSRTQRAPPIRTDQAFERVGQPVGVVRIVQDSLLSVRRGFWSRPSMAGATTGRPLAMYSNTFNGDQ